MKAAGKLERQTAGGNGIMNTQTAYKTEERGVALVMALLMILVLGLLAATVMFTAQAQAWTGLNYRLTSQSRYAAEAGVQATMNWLSSTTNNPAPSAAVLAANYDMTKNPVQCKAGCTTIGPVVLSSTSGVSSNYPTSSVATAFGSALSQSLTGVPNASYSTTATLLRISQVSGVSWLGASGGGGVVETWQITSTGTVTGLRNATVQVTATYEQGTTPVFPYGLEATGDGCPAILLNGGSSELTDSYNSTLGTYASQSAAGTTGSNGNIATNGNVYLGSGATVKGTISTHMAGTVGACPSNGVTNSSGKAAPPITGGMAKIPTVLPWGCAPAPATCTTPGTLITTTQNPSTSCLASWGCTKGTPTCSTAACSTIAIGINGGSIPSSPNANVYTLAPGSYGNLQIFGNDVVHVTAGTYTVNSLNFGDVPSNYNGQIVVDSGPVIFNMVGNCAGGGCPHDPTSGSTDYFKSYPAPACNSSVCPSTPTTAVIFGAGGSGFNVCGPGVVANPGDYYSTSCGTAKTPVAAVPANFQIVYAGTDIMRVGGMPNAAVTYAPQATYYSPGGIVGYFGSIVTGNFADTSTAPFHYDDALKNSALQVGQFRPVGGFSWTKF
jgi:Tfp pilus assembly protein PilX